MKTNHMTKELALIKKNAKIHTKPKRRPTGLLNLQELLI